jgi:hypothetical protein
MTGFVEPSSILLPQAQVMTAGPYLGWIPSFIDVTSMAASFEAAE